MNEKHSRDEKIDLYLSGNMSTEDKVAFEHEMLGDQTLAAEIELMRHIVTGFERKGERSALQAMGDLSSEEEMKSIIRNAERKYRPIRKTNRILISAVSAAAAILAFVVIGLQPRYSTAELYKEYYAVQEYEFTPSRGGSALNEQKQEQFDMAVGLYEQKDYAGALKLFDEIASGLAPEQTPEELTFYSAICLIRIDRVRDAVEKLEYLVLKGDADFEDDARWELALIYLKDNKRAKAEELLGRLVEKDGYYSGKARELAMKLHEKKWF